ncbi:hypothetical protein [Neobacillus muris]|uniref:hypothetical protein n=1 Tax=Neobacillus muris TaxID=2941334 RepID=UPI0020403E98|nr:hypothetical protein [Neobacillus muris]
MRTLGIRVEPKCVHYSVVENNGDSITLKTVDSLTVPLALDTPRSLSFIRTSLISLIEEYEITKAGIKVLEGNTRSLSQSKFRLNVEGVIQELFANSTVNDYVCATKNSLASLLDADVEEITELIEGERNVFELESWETYQKIQREAIITAIATVYI